MRKKCQMEALGQVYKNCHTIFFNLPNGPYNSFRQNYQSKTMYLHSTFNTLHWNGCQFCVDLSIGYNCTLNNEVYLFQKIFFDSSRTEIRSFGSKKLNGVKIVKPKKPPKISSKHVLWYSEQGISCRSQLCFMVFFLWLEIKSTRF